MSQTNPAFKVQEINLETGEVVIVIQKGIIGSMANQLKTTNSRRKGSGIIQKMGHVLSACGNVLYGEDIDSIPDLDNNLVNYPTQ